MTSTHRPPVHFTGFHGYRYSSTRETGNRVLEVSILSILSIPGTWIRNLAVGTHGERTNIINASLPLPIWHWHHDFSILHAPRENALRTA